MNEGIVDRPAWWYRSAVDIENVSTSTTDWARFAVTELYLAAVLEEANASGEQAMREALAWAYETGDLNFLQRHIEVIAYKLTGSEPLDPKSLLYEVRYEDRGRLRGGYA